MAVELLYQAKHVWEEYELDEVYFGEFFQLLGDHVLDLSWDWAAQYETGEIEIANIT
ncbi:hypothetical protein [Agromyces badenianii]|uniref:hypothetical protein n=1 Tax=Agromyces badenianii TaxID=2080742 RepID=UPI0014045008|nr:hypothetical protein [Agromyces badenianii]